MYKVLISNRAEKQIKSLPEKIRTKVKAKLIDMESNPFSGDVKKLKVSQNRYRARVGQYRIIFDVDKKTVIAYILTVRHRKDAYR